MSIDINSKPSTSAIASGDSVFLSKSNSALYKIDYNLLAKAIIEQYSSSTLVGSAQSIQSAFNVLDCRTPGAYAGWHNSVYRGKNITSYFTDGSLWNRINGSSGYELFEDLFIGDYITVGNNSYAIVDFDYYIRCGNDADFNVHHIIMMPTGNMNIPAGTVLYGSSDTLVFINTANAGVTVSSQESATAFKWNATMDAPNTNSTNGGYKYSRMRTVIMKAANTIVINAFGAAHVKPLSVLYYNPASDTTSGLASGWAWFSDNDQTSLTCKSICDLPNETQVYG